MQSFTIAAFVFIACLGLSLGIEPALAEPKLNAEAMLKEINNMVARMPALGVAQVTTVMQMINILMAHVTRTLTVVQTKTLTAQQIAIMTQTIQVMIVRVMQTLAIVQQQQGSVLNVGHNIGGGFSPTESCLNDGMMLAQAVCDNPQTALEAMANRLEGLLNPGRRAAPPVVKVPAQLPANVNIVQNNVMVLALLQMITAIRTTVVNRNVNVVVFQQNGRTAIMKPNKKKAILRGGESSWSSGEGSSSESSDSLQSMLEDLLGSSGSELESIWSESSSE